MFAYSERERTLAYRKFEDDVPHEIKNDDLPKSSISRWKSKQRNQLEIGKRHLVFGRGNFQTLRRTNGGRTDTNKMVIFDRKNFKKGDYIEVEITDSTSATLKAIPIKKNYDSRLLWSSCKSISEAS